MSSQTLSSASTTSGTQGYHVGLIDLPTEIALSILEKLPDMQSLINVCQAHPRLAAMANANQHPLAFKILRNDLPEEVFSHARAAFKADELAFPDLWTLNQENVVEKVQEIPKLRDRVTTSKLSLADAMAIWRTHRRVTELTDAFFKDCHRWGDQDFTALRLSLEGQEPSSSERTRVSQAIYLFEILRKTFGGMRSPPRTPEDDDDSPSPVAIFHDNMDALHRALVTYALAPWELQQVISITSFFRRKTNPDNSKLKFLPHFS
jgi:hypothetical protein